MGLEWSLCNQVWSWTPVASDSAAGLSHEDLAQLPPPEEDGEGQRHTHQKLMEFCLASSITLEATFTLFAHFLSLSLYYNITLVSLHFYFKLH